jgi:hypothetical protein
MMGQEITMLFYNRALALNDARPEAAAAAIEMVLPSEKMLYEVRDDGSLVALDDRKARLAGALKARDIPLLCNGDVQAPVVISWLNIPAILCPKQTALSVAMVKLPKSSLFLGVAEDLLGCLGDALRAFWGVATPDPSAAVIGMQLSPLGPGPAGLPSLQPMSKLPGPEFPERLGWIIYLSTNTARIMRFPDAERDSGWLRRARRTNARAWLLRLTDEPLLVPENEEHLATLKAAYVRFRGY